MMKLCLLKQNHDSYILIRQQRSRGVGIGLVCVTPLRGLIPYSLFPVETCSNNVAEYEALIISLELAFKMRIDQKEVFGDSQLTIRHVTRK